jgi:hypothetical protein
MWNKNKYFIQDGMISKFDFMDNQEFYPLTTLCSMLNDNDEKYDNLAKKFVIVSKALELACKELCKPNTLNKELLELETYHQMVGYFTTKAREVIDNE